MPRLTSLVRTFIVLTVAGACLFALAPGLLARAGQDAETARASGSAAPSPKVNATNMGEAFFIMRNPLNQRIEWVGTLLVWVLIALSVTCTSLIGTLVWTHRGREYIPAGLVEALKGAFYEKRHDAAFRALAGDRSMLAGIVAAALRQAPHGHLAMIRAAEQRADEISVQRLRSIEALNVIGNVAPMLGLFGTVYGIILSFREIVASGGTPDPVSLAAGIGTALVATFWGLIVAIPALAFYGILRARIDGRTVEAASVAEELLASLKPATTPSSDPR